MTYTPIIAACYTYPVKGMTTHSMPSLELRPGESVVGDRAFIFAFGNAEMMGSIGWVSKRQSVTMLNTPYLPWIESGWNPESRELTVTVKGQTRTADVDDPASRAEMSEWMTDVVLGLPENPLRGRPEREPLRLLGDGDSRFTDRGPTQISLGGLASLTDLSDKAGVDVDVRRFRLNFSVEGVGEWDEFEWVGKRVKIGESVEIDVTAPIQRCNAVNASPTGEGRDLDLMKVLNAEYGHLNFGVEANVVVGGEVRVGDELAVVG